MGMDDDMNINVDTKVRQRNALRKVWSDTFALSVDNVFLDLIIDTVEGA